LLGLLEEEQWLFILVDKVFLVSPHIKGIIMGVDEVSRGASGMSVGRIGEVDDRTNEGHAAGMYGKTFYSRVSGKGRVGPGMEHGCWGLRLVLKKS
jgi:hypothetical protein